jgi:trk system potassium uptake protein TrkH
MERTLLLQRFPRRVWDWLRTANFTAVLIVPTAFLGVILCGAGLLLTPFATTGGPIRFIDALFTMTSAVCDTGLVVVSTAEDFTVFGQSVILTGIQVGGLGYSTMATLLLLALGQRIALRRQMLMMEVFSTLSREGLLRLIKVIVAVTFILEGTGALILAARFTADMDLLQALYYGIFHSVAAFNNAGFSLFSDNLLSFRGDIVVNVTVALLVILGGIGFLIFRDIAEKVRKQRTHLSTQTKLALLVTGVLILVGTVGIWGFEIHNDKTLGQLPFGEQVMAAAFQSVSARTAGFTTLDLSVMGKPALYLLILLMIVGGSPGGTAGGIKTTTLGVIAASIWSLLKGRADVMMFHRRIAYETVMKCFVLAALAWGLVTGFTMLLSYSEGQDFLRILFEVASAAGTVGFSTGNDGGLSFSAMFSDFGKTVIIASMFIGRLGPLGLGLFAVRTHEELRYRYAAAPVVVG